MTAFSKMYYPKLTFASSTIEGIFLFGILCLSNKIYGLDPKISLEVSKSCMWEKPRFASEQHPYWPLFLYRKKVSDTQLVNKGRKW